MADPVGAGASPAGRTVAAWGVWLLDLDGTLVDSGPAHEAAFRRAIAEVAPGLLGRFRYAEHAGASTRDVAARLGVVGEAGERLVRRKQELYREHLAAGRVALFPGARRLLDRLARHGRTAYLVTGGSRGSVERVLAGCGLASRLRGVLTADDLPCGKPDPEVYRRACATWAIDPADALVVEDSPQGVTAAVGAGLATLHVHTDRPAPGAIAVRDLEEIVSLLDKAEGGDG